MAELLTDEEKVEAIKKWWKANGVSVVAGVVIGLGAVFGWRGWVSYQTGVAQQASIAFEQLLATAATGQVEATELQAGSIVDDFGGTPYAMFADLALARTRADAGDLPGAALALEAAIGRAPEPALARLAALRLARVLIADDQLERAADVIDQHDDDAAFAADFAALRGDIALRQGRADAARTAYRAAIDGGAGNSRLIELKLENLPATDAS
ncbi:tetratricopeptide repeat protein [Thiohalocapsa marina]|uniref:Ancillary SecYEG translocon subunit n=1 Tax=Thiohalocapsa marina TaxID=424902 RepID=A0A5M8FF51_9GAMM|nr:tetratricopeptide repeat protein [Thiohalocapsa marina]KAA6183309.1 tetratricopeptide repeat protein [Thiohalocapsa marina]